jgi:hypothetical protein
LSRSPGSEKCIRQLPTIRISEPLETALMRMAARDDRTLSEYIRLVLERHAFGHASSVLRDESGVSDFGALQSTADEVGGARR